MNFKSMLLNYTAWSVLTGFIFGVLVSLFCFNNIVEEYMINTQSEGEKVFYTVEMLTDEMEVEWIPMEE